MLLLAMVMLSSSINLARATTDAADLDYSAASTVPTSSDLHSEVHKAMEAKISGIRAKISGVREAHESMLAAVHPVIAP